MIQREDRYNRHFYQSNDQTLKDTYVLKNDKLNEKLDKRTALNDLKRQWSKELATYNKEFYFRNCRIRPFCVRNMTVCITTSCTTFPACIESFGRIYQDDKILSYLMTKQDPPGNRIVFDAKYTSFYNSIAMKEFIPFAIYAINVFTDKIYSRLMFTDNLYEHMPIAVAVNTRWIVSATIGETDRGKLYALTADGRYYKLYLAGDCWHAQYLSFQKDFAIQLLDKDEH